MRKRSTPPRVRQIIPLYAEDARLILALVIGAAYAIYFGSQAHAWTRGNGLHECVAVEDVWCQIIFEIFEQLSLITALARACAAASMARARRSMRCCSSRRKLRAVARSGESKPHCILSIHSRISSSAIAPTSSFANFSTQEAHRKSTARATTRKP